MTFDEHKENPLSPWLPQDHSLKNKTGKWATHTPKVNLDKCSFPDCVKCWIFCPDGSISFKNNKVIIDLRYCKGCGICSKVCPNKAINMVKKK